MFDGSDGIHIVAVINPCLYGVAFPGSRINSVAGIYGIVPPEFSTTTTIPALQVPLILDRWRNYNSHIKELISSADKIEFTHECSVDGVLFGNFTFTDSGTGNSYDLKEHLLETTIGVLSKNPQKDALIIKDNSFKPGDFSSSLSSSDESTSPAVKEKRKIRSHARDLKKPNPLPHTRLSFETSSSKTYGLSLSQEDSSIIQGIYTKQSLPSEYIFRLTTPRNPDIFASSIPSSPSCASSSTSKKKTPVKEINWLHYSSVGESEVTSSYSKDKEDWIAILANKHSSVKIRKPLVHNNIEMSSTASLSPNTSSTTPPRIGRRGMLLKTIMERNSTENIKTPEKVANPLSGMGRGQYFKSAAANSPVAGGRGYRLRQMLEQNESRESVPPPCAMRRVFSIDVFGNSPEDTNDEGNASSSSQYASSVIYKNGTKESNESNDSASVTSVDSTIQSHPDQSQVSSTSQPEDPNASDSDANNSSSNIISDKQESLVNEEMSDLAHFHDFLDRIVAFGGLVHGKNTLPPVNVIADTDLHPMIVEMIRNKKIRDLNRTQTHAIRHLLARRNVVIIGPAASGKTFTAMIPLLSLLCETDYYSDLKPGCGPRAVFLTTCAHKVRNVVKDLNAISHLTIVPTYGGGLELEQMAKLTNGCDVLVSTPRCWLRLLTYKWITSTSRLCHLFIDDLDVCTSLYNPELMNLFKVFDDIREKRAGKGPEPQLVLIGESWTPILNNLVLSRTPDPVICWTSFLEAALYSNIKPTLHILSPLSKLEKLNDLLEKRDKVPTIIVCNNSDEVILLRKLLYCKRTKVLGMHNGMVFTMIRDIHNDWHSCVRSKESPPMLITCDDTLADLGISNAKWLIQYSLPPSKTIFNYRFCTIKSHFIDRITHPEKVTPDCFVDIFVDHTNEEQLADIMLFMQRMKTPIPPEIQSAVEKIANKKEASKNIEVGLCHNLLQFGYCWKKMRCMQQHCINYDRDKARNLPLSGYVKFTTLKVHSPIHYSVRLVAHTEDPKISPDCWTSLSSQYTQMAVHLNNYYSNRNNRRMHGNVQIGDLAAVEMEVDTQYRRVKILQITEKNEKLVPVTVKVLFVDVGMIRNIKAINLLHLPNELRTYPRSSVDIYLTGLLPVDLDRDWSNASTSITQKKIMSMSEDLIFVAKISLVLGYAVLAESVKALEILEDSKCTVVHLNMKSYLLDRNIAIRNPDHLGPLIELCREGKLLICAPLHQGNSKQVKIVSQKKLTKSQSKITNLVMWAHLPRDEMSSVILCSAENPSLFYVSHLNFLPLLERLEKEIAADMEESAELINVANMSPNMICLARYDYRWNRAMLLEESPQTNEESGQLLYPVWFVDYGDVAHLPASDIALCPDKYVKTLPFQAIKCELVGLNPLNGEWPPETCDVMYKLSQLINNDDNSKTFKELSLIVAGYVDDTSSSKSGKHYKVILVDRSTNDSDVVLNKEIVFLGYANWNPEEKHLLDSFDINNFKMASFTADDETPSEETTYEDCKEDDTDTISEVEGSVKSVERDNNDMTDMSSDASNAQFLDMLENLDINVGSEYNSPLLMLAALKKKVLSAAGRDVKAETVDLKSHNRSHSSMNSENDADISELEDSRKANVPYEFHLKSGFFTPKTVWLQNELYLYIRILLHGLNEYSLQWSSNHIDFSATYDGKRYRLLIDLFGSIVPAHLFHFSRGQYVEIKALKLFTDTKWSRLLYDEKEKPFWLQVECNDNEEESNILAPGEHFKEGKLAYDQIFLDDEQSDSSDYEMEPDNVDFYDPLAFKG